MLIRQTTYPEFVPDQILSSEHLNRLFGYLEEQERLTRANLLGIGIVCGLEIKMNTAGTQLTITKGSGVTSKGYLVSTLDTIYTGYKAYDINRNHTYPLFTDIFDDNPNSGFRAYELTQDLGTAGVSPLSAVFLQDYVVMMYVELRAETTEDCDTNDCDYEGVMVTVNPRPLLIPKSFVTNFTSSATDVSTGITNLPEIALRRFDVTATSLDGSASIIDGYRKILTEQVTLLGNALTSTFISLYPFVSDEYPTNPFPDLVSDLFYFLNDSSYPVNNMLHVQYYYDLLADIYNGYNMIRENGDHLISVCNADETLFPQHLLLGPAVNMSVDGGRVDYRNYFMPSGAMQSCCGQVGGLRLEFKRLVLLLQNFVLPVAYSDTVGGEAVDAISLRITPDVLGNVSLSEKSIPFYYDVNRPGDTDKLFRYWDYSKTHAGHADRNLSYNADQYRTGNSDDPILQPLYYDLENYNFLRIEGHIGLSYREAVNTILGIRDRHRLPFEVIAIRTTQPADSILKKLCCGDGLELSYDIVRREWEAVVGATIAFINSNLESARTLLGFNEFDANEADAYVDKLQKVKAYLVNDMSAFMVRYDEFIGKYEEIESESARLRDKIYGQLGELGGSMYVFGEDLIDHLDAAGHSAKKGAFRAVEQAWRGLAASVEETLSLHEYARIHPGLSHKAGVPLGGTFVIIYHTENAEEDNKALVRKASNSNEVLQASSQAPGSVDEMLAKIPEGMVIADFYLPYLCCSDCSPVEVSIGNGKPPVVKPTISIEGNITSLCLATAKENYSLTIQPDEANVTATVNGANVNGVVVNNGSSWQFIPAVITFASNETQKTVKITAEKDGQTSSIQIIVYALPVLAFTQSPNPNDPNTITFTGASTHIAGNASVTWTFSNNSTGYVSTINAQAGTPVSNTFPTNGTDQTYTVTLSAGNNGACTTAPTSQTVIIKSSLPCGGEKQTCNFVWPYAQDRTVLMKAMVAEAQSQSIVLNLQILNFKVEGQSPYFIPSQPLTFAVPSIQPFSDNWRIIAQKINALYQNVSMPVIFGTTAGTYQNTGYLVPLTSYACLGFEFEFNFWITVNGVPQSQYKDHYVFVKDKSGTSTFQILKDNTTKSLVYADPRCSAISSPPIER